jgi:hypothetical protein
MHMAHGGVVAVVPAGSHAMGSGNQDDKEKQQRQTEVLEETHGHGMANQVRRSEWPKLSVARRRRPGASVQSRNCGLGARVSSYLGGPGKDVAEDDRTSPCLMTWTSCVQAKWQRRVKS